MLPDASYRTDWQAGWATRWERLARAAGIGPRERLTLALSGGADSVLLLHLAAAAMPRPDICAVHVNHGLRGDASDADARFCRHLAASLGIPYIERRVQLDPGPSLEARAREARYGALADVARASGHTTIVTGHHEDDALETLLMRWMRGTEAAGWAGPRVRLDGVPGVPRQADEELRVVRPLLPLRRAEVHRLLSDRGLTWREDESNRDPTFTRNRARAGLLPLLEEYAGSEARDGLLAFGRAVEELEDRLAARTSHLAWAPPRHAAATRGPAERSLGGRLQRGELMRLQRALQRRVLWRLLREGTGRSPGRNRIETILDELARGSLSRHSLPGSWSLILRSDELVLVPPISPTLTPPPDPQLRFSFAPPAHEKSAIELPVPGIVSLDDGRRVTAEIIDSPDPPDGNGREVVLDAERLPSKLSVRLSRPGDRFHGLGAPGSKRLTRFLADRGVPREERGLVPVVVAEEEIVWVCGLEPAESRRVRPDTRRRVRLRLL